MRFVLNHVALSFTFLCAFQHAIIAQITSEADDETDRVQSAAEVAVASPTGVDPEAKTDVAEACDYSPRELYEKTKSLLRAEATARTRTAKLQKALELVATLHAVRELRDSSNSRLLKSAEQRLLVRLHAIQKRTRAEMRTRRTPPRIKVDQTVLAQLGQAVRANRNGPGNQAGANVVPGATDYGRLLVELIQQTISPATWDVNGGASSIQYYRPKHALVIRAPQTVHDDIAPLLLQLRKQ